MADDDSNKLEDLYHVKKGLEMAGGDDHDVEPSTKYDSDALDETPSREPGIEVVDSDS